jgi:hypothetical protein
MKTLIYLFAVAMFLFAGCAKDEMFEEDMNLKSAEMKMIPMKAEFYSVSTESDDYGGTAAGYLVGNFTHLGKIIPEQSTYKTTISDYSSYPLVIFKMDGQLAADNGDLLFYTLDGTMNMSTGAVDADVTYPGGTGRLEKYTGNAHFAGQFDPATGYIYCKLEGTLFK